MPLLQEKTVTIDYIYSLPDNERAELIDGQIYYMAPPSTNHQRILNYINNSIYNHIKSNNGTCEVFPAPFAVFLNKDDKNYFEPDISVVCDKDKLDDKGCHGAPDWIIEVTSPGNSGHDYVLKLNKYMIAGVKEYWIVNPMEQMISVYYFLDENFSPHQYTFKDIVKVNIYDDFSIDFNEFDF